MSTASTGGIFDAINAWQEAIIIVIKKFKVTIDIEVLHK